MIQKSKCKNNYCFCRFGDLKKLDLISSTDQECFWSQNKMPIVEQFKVAPVHTFCGIKRDRLKELEQSVLDECFRDLITCDKTTGISCHYNRQEKSQQPSNKPETSKVVVVREFDSTNSRSAVSIRQPLAFIENIPSGSQNLNIESANSASATEDVKKYLAQIINQSFESESIKSLQSLKYDLQDCCKAVFNEKIKCDDVLNIAMLTFKLLSVWKAERQFLVTGSRCYGLFTYSKDEWVSKISSYFWPKSFTSPYTDHGLKYENAARDIYTATKNVFVLECGLVVSKLEPWLAYSPDGIVISNGKIDRLLEIKCPFDLPDVTNETLLEKCSYLVKSKHGLTLKKRHKYYGQVQLGMAILNLEKCDFAVYSNVSNVIKIIEIKFDNVFIKNFLIKLKKIYFERMLHQICVFQRA